MDWNIPGRNKPERPRLVSPLSSIILLSIVLFCPWGLPAQPTGTQPTGTQPVESGAGVSTLVSPEFLRPGLRFTLTINLLTQEPEGIGQIQVEDVQWPDGLSLIFGPEVSTQQGTQGTQVVFYLRAEDPGWWLIPSFTIRKSGISYRVDQTLVGVAVDRNGFIPPRLQWKVGTQSLVEGQSIGVILELSQMTEYSFPEGLQFDTPQGALFEEVSGLGDVVIRNISEQEFFCFPVAGFILTPSQTGTIRLPSAQILVDGNRVSVEPLTLKVNPMPSDIQPTGAVGDFTVSSALEPKTLNPGDTAELRFRVEGTGNLNYMQLIEPEIQGHQAVSTNETYRFVPDLAGYRGYREVLYRIEVEQPGDLFVRIPRFVWFDPKQQISQSTIGQSFRVQILPVVSPSREGGTPGLSLMPVKQVAGFDLWLLYSRPEAYLVLLPFLFLGAGVAYTKRKRRTPRISKAISGFMILSTLLLGAAAPVSQDSEFRQVLSQAEQHFTDGDYAQFLELYEELLEAHPNNPGVYHNLGVGQTAMGNRDMGIYYLGRALRLAPQNTLLRTSLSALQESNGLDRQHIIAKIPQGDHFFLIGITATSLLLLFIPLWVRRGTPGKTVLLSILLVVIVGSTTGLALYQKGISDSIAIVKAPEGILKKIPENDAADWLKLPSGTSLRYSDSSGDFVLIETAYGITGWMRADSIIGVDS